MDDGSMFINENIEIIKSYLLISFDMTSCVKIG